MDYFKYIALLYSARKYKNKSEWYNSEENSDCSPNVLSIIYDAAHHDIVALVSTQRYSTDFARIFLIPHRTVQNWIGKPHRTPTPQMMYLIGYVLVNLQSSKEEHEL